MTIYRLSLSEKIGGEHRGYQYFTAHEAMEKCKAEAKATDLIGETSVIVLATTKAGIVDALNVYGGHADKG
jgi:hypothetical protein